MAIREELVTSAISFLQDPSVASAPLEKKIAFLESKNLTKEEIDASLARASDPSAAGTATSAAPSSAPATYQYGRPPVPAQQYGAAYPAQYWQPPPPELPKRDWRDWFIMATVLGGVGYGLYFTAKRYILPKISPPTPDQLTQDKASVDSSFEKAFALLDQLSKDTDTLKEAEESRTKRLDSALSDFETILSALKDSEKRREDDARRNADEIRGLRDLIPQALEQQKRSADERLKDLGNELKSLKTLVGNRMAPPPLTSTPSYGMNGTSNSNPTNTGLNGAASTYVPPSVSAPSSSSATTSAPPVRPVSMHKPATSNGTNGLNGTAAATSTEPSARAVSPVPASTQVQAEPALPAVERPQSAAPSFSSRFGSGGGKAAIPAWQMAAAKKAQAPTVEDEKKDEGGAVSQSAAGPA